jgi:hypothetical protein
MKDYRPHIRIASAAVVACVALAAAHVRAEPDAPVYASSTYPIRVFSNDAALGEAALVEAETAWEQQIDGMGFGEPERVADGGVEDGFDVWVDDTIGSGVLVTFDILGDNPATPRTDCPTIGRLNAAYMDDADILRMSVRHVLNHGSLHAVDCLEPQMPAFDTITVAVEVETDDAHPYWLSAYLPAFQAQPTKALDWVTSDMNQVFYMFGSALFALFLDEKYGDGDGAFLVDAWARTPQDGTILTWNQEWCTSDAVNEPDYLDAIAAELEERGASMEEALVAFTEWRYFVGEDDDGAHFAKGASWAGGEVKRLSQISAADLPVMDGANEQIDWLGETGSAFVELDAAGIGASQRLAFSFDGNADTRWAAQLLLVPADGPAVVQPIALTDDNAGASGDVDPAPYAKIVLAVTDLGDGVHDPEDQEWSTLHGTFHYSIEAHAADDGAPDAGADADAGDTGAAGSDGGCSCRAAGVGATEGLLAAIL